MFEAAAFLRCHGADITWQERCSGTIWNHTERAGGDEEADVYKNPLAIAVCPGDIETI